MKTDMIDIIGVRSMLAVARHERVLKLIREVASSTAWTTPIPFFDAATTGPRQPAIHRSNGLASVNHWLSKDEWWMGDEGWLCAQSSVTVPETFIHAMEGRPITDLISHASLDPTMIVQEVRGSAQMPRMNLINIRRPMDDVIEALIRRETPA